jgi:hypothetical protein
VETNSESVTDVSDVIAGKAKELETLSGPGFSQGFHGHALGAADESNHIASWTDLEVGNLSIVKESRTSNVMDDGVLNFSQPWNDSEFQTMNSTLWQGADDWDEFGFSGFFGIGHPSGPKPSYTNPDTITTGYLAGISMYVCDPSFLASYTKVPRRTLEPARPMYKSTTEDIYKSEDHAKL